MKRRILVAYAHDGARLVPHVAELMPLSSYSAKESESRFRNFWRGTHVEAVEVELPVIEPKPARKGKRVRP